MSDDLRELLDPIAAVLGARPKWRQVPEQILENPPDEETGEVPPPVIIPARTEVYVDPDELPDVVASDGFVDLGAQLAVVQSMLAWIWDEMQLRTVTAQHVLGTGTYLAGQILEFPVAWSTAPAKTPTSALVAINAPVAWLGRTTASVKPGTVTASGATLVVRVLSAISPSGSNPIVYDVTGTYFYVPPYQPQEST